MNIKKDIENMVEVAYQRVIEGEGIHQDFVDADIDTTSDDIDSFINSIPKSTIKKWHKKLEKKVLKNVLEFPESYMVDVSGDNLTWKDSGVEDWMMQYFCNKIVKLYQKENPNLPLKKYSYSVSTPTIWTSFDYGELEATSYEQAKELAQKQIDADVKKANDALKAVGMDVGIDSSQVEIKEIK